MTNDPSSTATRSHEVEQWLHMYEQMFKIRVFEEQVDELYKTAEMPGLAHLYIGEESVLCDMQYGLIKTQGPVRGDA